ncbi:hypothetical protein [Deminuibacter soli]|uniref:Uncharacterized protein n=1 Tax=Deminuibacter soli TaxID=2291815 RepID=A0A3E1NME2_9BACT|nr:hypothetical protein [Deminuibacter soli]RFM29105.1 hypothetical protein DXN05_10145 [Deminuibacter soli]
MKMRKTFKIILIVIGVYLVCYTTMAFINHIYSRPTLEGCKAFALNSFKDNPEKMAALKASGYYAKITQTNRIDSVDIYFHQYLAILVAQDQEREKQRH